MNWRLGYHEWDILSTRFRARNSPFFCEFSSQKGEFCLDAQSPTVLLNA